MKDMMHKAETIRQIEYLQLSRHLIGELEDTQQAQSLVMAIQSLQALAEQWN